jgi:sorting nexin-1/2
LDVLESQLRSLLKAVEAIIKQRKDLGVASAEFGESIVSLAGTELNKPLANSLLVLGNLKIRIKELHEKQAHMDVLTLEHTVDEYIRTIGSIRTTFYARGKFNQNMAQAQSDLTKKRANYEKMSQPSRKTKPERLAQLALEITEAERRVDSTKRDFEEISSLIRQEFDRFDREKVEDFKQSVEAFLASMVQHQREIVSLWENYFRTLSGAGSAAAAAAAAGGAGGETDNTAGEDEDKLQSPTRLESPVAASTQDHVTTLPPSTDVSFAGGSTEGIRTSPSNDILAANEWST